MTLKTAISSIGNGALSIATEIHNSSITTQIDELDVEITKLVEKRQNLENQLIKK